MEKTNEERGTHLESSTFGTASKGGALKIYYPADNFRVAQGIIQNAIDLHFEARVIFDRRNAAP